MATALVDVARLRDELDDPALRILDATVVLRRQIPNGPYTVESGRSGYERVHIPGAGFADIPGALSDPDSPFPFTLPTAERFAAGIGALGVGPDTRVVAYAQESPMWATRLWWLLRYFGFDNIAVLDGGLAAWLEAGYPVATGSAERAPAAFSPRERRHLVASKADVLWSTRDGQGCLVNALPTAAFRGEEPGAYSRPGRIPGSVSHPAQDLLDPATGRFLPPAQLAHALAGVYDLPEGIPIIAYCGGGISATVDIFALALLGREDMLLYDGSLTEWSADPSLPLERG